MAIFDKLGTNKPKPTMLEGPQHPHLEEISKILRDIYDWFPSRNRLFDFNDTTGAFEEEIRKWSLACFNLHGVEAARLGAKVIQSDRLSIEQLRQLTFPYFMAICREEKLRAKLSRDTQERINPSTREKTEEEFMCSKAIANKEFAKMRAVLGEAKIGLFDNNVHCEKNFMKIMGEKAKINGKKAIKSLGEPDVAPKPQSSPVGPKFYPAEMPEATWDNADPSVLVVLDNFEPDFDW